MQTELRREALRLAEEFRERNRTALLNLLSDSTIALTGFILLLRSSNGRGALFRTIGRVFSGFSDTAKAFLIIASAFLGQPCTCLSMHEGGVISTSVFFCQPCACSCSASTTYIRKTACAVIASACWTFSHPSFL